jgi:poly-gamma-glutamate synthesis protein (capsule biosynthesis protein)
MITGLPDEKAVPIIKSIVDKAKRDCDLVAVCLHWGIERQPQPAANQVRLGRMFIDQGADIVIGSHPHVLEPGELYKGKPIIYSLGNLVYPRSGSTALYRLQYEGTSLKRIDYFPAIISEGKVALTGKMPSKPAAAIQAENVLRKRYPSDFSGTLIGMK